MEGFRHTFAVDVRFRDIDALGHVNNAVYLTYLESARIDYFRQAVHGGVAQPIGAVGVILAEITCTYRAPIFMGQRIRIGTRTVDIGRSSYRIESRVEADETLAALAKVVLVQYDYALQRSTPIPEEIRRRILAFEHS
jgi:acyl-CoA thioester hydrolase